MENYLKERINKNVDARIKEYKEAIIQSLCNLYVLEHTIHNKKKDGSEFVNLNQSFKLDWRPTYKFDFQIDVLRTLSDDRFRVKAEIEVYVPEFKNLSRIYFSECYSENDSVQSVIEKGIATRIKQTTEAIAAYRDKIKWLNDNRENLYNLAKSVDSFSEKSPFSYLTILNQILD